MADKNSVTDWSETAGDNDNVGGVPLGENVMLPSNVNNAFRVMMAQLKAFFKSTVFRLRDNSDETKLLAFDLSGLTTATTRTQIVPDENGRQALQPHLAGHLYGLTLSNNVADATNDIDVAVGVAIDSTNAYVMTLGSAITKRLDAAWAVGNNGGGLDTGAIANNTYHVFLIKRVDTGVVDVLFSASPTSPTLPTNYTLFRRIGSILRETGAIVAFAQRGDIFLRANASPDVSATDPGTAAVTRTLAVPNLIAVDAMINVYLSVGAAAGNGSLAYISSFDQADAAPDGTTAPLASVAAAKQAATNVASAPMQVRTTTSRTIRSRLSVSDANIALRIATLGWIDTRGK